MKKRVLPLVLTLALILPLPVLGAETAPAKTYEQAVAELRNEDMYAIYDTIDAESCTVFLYRRIGTPHIQLPVVDIVYKDGVVARPDLSPEEIRLSGDGKQLICTDSFDPSQGTNVYTVDLASGEILGKECVLPTQEQLFDWFLKNSTEERRLEGAEDTVVLFSSAPSYWVGREKEYFLYLICREPSRRADPVGWFRRLVLPSTTVVEGGNPQYPTDRAPDELFLNEDGSVLTYVYSFEEPLFNADGETLHEAGKYTYRVDTATGELNVSHTPLPSPALGAEGTTFVDVDPGDWFARGVAACAREGIMTGTGADAFSPEATLTYPECVMLAYRLYDRAQGGDGSLLKAPEGWGYMSIDTDDGRLRHEGFAGDSNVWGYTSLTDGGGTYIYVKPKDMEMLSRFHDYPGFGSNGATVTLEGTAYHGAVVMTRQIAYQTYYFTFRPDDPGVTDLLVTAQSIPAGDKWWRDLAYTVKQRGWEELFPLYPQAHTAIRYTFADQLAAVTELPRRFEVPVIPDLSREDFPQVFRLYEAGILGGTDNYGTFTGGGELTRAEAAVMAARVLDESQRLREPPRPMPSPETGGYTLTYLADGSLSWYSADRQPFCCLERRTGESESGPVGFLTLEGELIPWEEIVPKGMEWDGMERQGRYVRIWLRDRETGELFAGILDENARWVVPPGEYDSVWVLEEGFGASSGWGEEVRFFLLDGEGQVLRQAEYDDPAIAAPEYYPQPQPWGGVTAPSGWLPGRRYYQWPDGSPASCWFDDCGELSPDGRGFVEKDGRVYRIQFET